jgi:UDP:flavonoid glycosyltransferase YjiC (YdhE family)
MSNVTASVRRLLFIAENVSLSQVVRLASLARRLDPERYEVHFACSEFDPIVFSGTSFQRWPLFSIDKDQALKRIERGQRLYETKLLSRYVADELALFEQVEPDLVIGDFRLSLAVSTAVARVRLATLINAYWSPYALRDSFPLPDHPIVDLLGVDRAARYFPIALPHVFAHFAAPLNALRVRHGLAPLGDLLAALTYGDLVLYPDVPELCSMQQLPEHHHFLGPVPWSPDTELPAGLLQDCAGKPLIYVTLGSSGRASALPAVLSALERLPVVALLATAGRPAPALPANVRVAEYVPGHLAARSARFVITNGGASTSYQALAEGRPVLGIPSNLDQHLAMTAIERARAGRSLRAGGLKADQVLRATDELMSSRALVDGASLVARAFSRFDCHERFSHLLARTFEKGSENASVS